jgi:glycosyltransferase involved in cell wall biosynthesis
MQARALGVPYVHVEHGSDYVQLDARLPSLAARAYDTGIGRQVLRRADVRLAISAAAGAFVRRLAGVDASVVYRGLPLDRLDAARPAPEASAFAAGRTLVVYVGRLIDGKGVGDLVSAMAQLGDHVCCAVIGDGPRGPELRRRAEALAPGRWRFTGYLPEDDALAWIRAADVVVNPSYTEGLPTTVLWAAALGRAIVATDVGGTGEVVRDGVSGLLVRPRAVAQLRGALAALAADPPRRERLGAVARQDALLRFDAAAGARRWLALAAGRISS